MTLRTKIIAVMTMPVVVLVGSLSATLIARGHTNDALAAERRAAALRGAFEQVQVDLNGAEDWMRGYLLTGDQAFLSDYEESTAATSTDMTTLARIDGGDRSLDELRALISERLAILQSSSFQAPVTDITNHHELLGDMKLGNSMMDEIRSFIARDERGAANLLAARERGLDATRRIAFLITVVGTPIGVLASLLVALVFMQRLVGRIRRTEENARRLEDGIPFHEASKSQDELGRLERMLVRSGSRVIELQAELRRQTTVDPLTRLINRRGFLPMAEHQLEIAKRTHQPVALLFADLDGLKSVNDTLGHAFGDAMITEAAYAMRQTFRASDLIARMGGDEFCILFVVASEAEAVAALARMERAVVDLNAQEGRPFTLSLSTGLAFFDPEEPTSLEMLISEADARMYARKRGKSDSHATVEPLV